MRQTEAQTTTKNYSRILFDGFQQWNEHYENDRDTQFAIDEINFLGNEIVEFLKTGLPELPEWARDDPPDWMSELCTLLAFCAAKDAFDSELEFKDRESWLRAYDRAFEAISPYVDNENQERIFQTFQLTYPLSGTFQKNGGRVMRARREEKYHTTIHLDEQRDSKKNETDDNAESKTE